MRHVPTAAIVLLLLSLPACTEPETEVDSTTVVQSEPVIPQETTPPEAAVTQETFVEKAATDGMLEVRLGEMAQQKAQSADVKSFGQMMVTDHTAANEKLKTIAQNLNVTVPSDLTPEQQEKADRLNGLSGAEFDREYMKLMVEDHQKAVELFEQASEGNLPNELKQFATDTLPTLEMHLERAQEIESNLTTS